MITSLFNVFIFSIISQTEENKVESLKREKGVSEKLLQETIDKKQTELETQKEHYTNSLNAAKEAKKVAEARANDEARNELESHLREAEERETMFVQTLEELRQTLSRKEQQVSVLNTSRLTAPLKFYLLIYFFVAGSF